VARWAISRESNPANSTVDPSTSCSSIAAGPNPHNRSAASSARASRSGSSAGMVTDTRTHVCLAMGGFWPLPADGKSLTGLDTGVRFVAMGERIHLQPTPDSVATARRWSTDLVAPIDGPAVADTVALLVSELVSNVVLHARTPCDLCFERTSTDLRVEVRDGSDRFPTPSLLIEPLAHSGRGMVLVEAMSDAHGVEPIDGGGKSVWFELRLPGAAP